MSGNWDTAEENRFESSGSRSYNQKQEWFNSNRTRGRGRYSGGGGYRAEPRNKTVIQVPSNKIGRIIGKGGSKIRDLQSNSGAQINIKKEVDITAPEFTQIELSGSEDSVNKVKSMIDNLIIDRNTFDGGKSYGKSHYSTPNDSHSSEHSDLIENGWAESVEEIKHWSDNRPINKKKYPSRESDRHSSLTDSNNSYKQSCYSWSNDSDQKKDNSFVQIDWKQLNEKCQVDTEAFWATLPTIVKNFYREDFNIAQMSPQEVNLIREQNNNTTISYVFGGDENEPSVPNPVVTFEQAFQHFPEILRNIKKMGFEKPTPIQAQSWPVLLRGQDLIGIAQTGTGKTLAFILPALVHIEGQTTPRSERLGPTVLVLAPTRELAQQIEKEVVKYNYKDIKAICLYGGGNRKEQVNLCKGVEIVIATPGRLSDLTVNGHIDMKSISYVVLDEADRMLDLGFEPQIRKIMLDIRPNRQTVMTSATWPTGVRSLAQSYMKNPIQVCIGTLDLAAVHTVTQTIRILEDSEEVKYQELLTFIHNMEENVKVIVFCGKKARVDHVASELALAGIDNQAMHGNLEQCDREQALDDIATGQVKILIATDVAARGIDINDITHVINYDFPRNIEEYVHRVGRTGRAGKTGEAISFVTTADWANAKELISILKEANQVVPDELYGMSNRFESYKERNFKRNDGKKDFGNRRSRGFGGRNQYSRY